ncbi:hypothetical protein ABSH63_14895 [Sinimarinibacterium sp. HSW-8]|uniref:AMP-binding enzyme C-terminal domain-containing protein n=1 Tax=Sinimarinibacterium thermocellulolyticum TaxID=3170016 RepID=A0ABV2ADQ7_9GAMM
MLLRIESLLGRVVCPETSSYPWTEFRGRRHEGYYRTGDGGYVDEIGRLYWEGRLTEIIKTGGANISPQEIDAVIALFPGVRRTQTVGVPHDTLGEMAVACIVVHDGVRIVEDELRAFLKQRLASFKVPRRFLFLSEEEMPVTANGKVKLTELKHLAGARLEHA